MSKIATTHFIEKLQTTKSIHQVQFIKAYRMILSTTKHIYVLHMAYVSRKREFLNVCAKFI